MSPGSSKICGNCAAYRRKGAQGTDHGECHAGPPLPILVPSVDPDVRGVWPPVSWKESCEAWREAKK